MSSGCSPGCPGWPWRCIAGGPTCCGHSPIPWAPTGLPYEVSLYRVNADMMETVQPRLPRGFTTGRYRIGYWFWELAHFPLTFAPAFHHTDEVWAPSHFCQQAFQSISTVEVRRVPPCVVPRMAAPAGREAFGIDPGRFLF